MSRLRIMLISIGVVFTGAGIVSASASAAACVAQAGAICQENAAGALVERVTAVLVKAPMTANKLELETIGTVECTLMESTLVLDETATGLLILPFVLSFEGCVLNGHVAECEVLETGGSELGHISTHGIKGTYVANEGADGDVNFTATGKLFAEIEIAGGACPLPAKVNISGSQLCLLLSAGILEATRLLECMFPGSNLKNGLKLAKFAVVAELAAISPGEAFQYLLGFF